MSNHQEALKQLKAFPMARYHSTDAALPARDVDPHPAQTLALHKLWASLRRYIAVDKEGVPSFVPIDNIQTPLQILQALEPHFVS